MTGFYDNRDKVDYVEARLENKLQGLEFDLNSKYSNIGNKIENLQKEIGDINNRIDKITDVISKLSFIDWIKLKIFNSSDVMSRLL